MIVPPPVTTDKRFGEIVTDRPEDDSAFRGQAPRGRWYVRSAGSDIQQSGAMRDLGQRRLDLGECGVHAAEESVRALDVGHGACHDLGRYRRIVQ